MVAWAEGAEGFIARGAMENVSSLRRLRQAKGCVRV
jgi:hypothetical protein